jgi:hypothetical protein
MLRRRWLLSALLCLPAAPALAADLGDDDPAAEPIPSVGPPLGTIELRVSEAKYLAFMHDLADFAEFYRLHIVGPPSNLVIDDRPILVIWFTRLDGVTVLVTDAAAHERMQAFFYVAQGLTSQAALPDIMQGYLNKMSGYPRFAEQVP